MGRGGGVHPPAPGGCRVNKRQALTRRAAMRALLAAPAALALPAWAAAAPMTVNEAIGILSQGVFRTAPERRLPGTLLRR